MLMVKENTDSDWECHQADNIWNDRMGMYWNGNISPSRFVHNYLGHNKCYEVGKSHWNFKTFQRQNCP